MSAPFAPPRPPQPGAPPAPPASPPATGWSRSIAVSAAGAILVLVGVGWLLDATTDVSVGWGYVLPAALVLVGVVLLLTPRHHVELTIVGVVLAIVVGAGLLVDVPLRGGVGDRTVTPTTSQTERLAMGQLTLQLVPPVGTQAVKASVGIGKIVAVVPTGTAYRLHAVVRTGSIELTGTSISPPSGTGVDWTYTDPGWATATSRLDLTLRVGVGQIEVRHG